MVDTLNPAERSARMALVRRTGTKPEKALRAVVRAVFGHRRRLIFDAVALLGSPDLAVPRLKLAIFAHGCFWHSCPKHGRLPKSNRTFWIAKLAANVRRDRAVARRLRKAGWSVWTVWEHDLTAPRIQATTVRLSRQAEQLKARRSLVS